MKRPSEIKCRLVIVTEEGTRSLITRHELGKCGFQGTMTLQFNTMAMTHIMKTSF